MVKKDCEIKHIFGPFIINNDGTATRKCFCCNKINKYNNVGDDIKEAVRRQDDVSFFVNLISNDKSFSFDDSDKFIQLISYINDDIDFLYINEDMQNKLLDNISKYNNLLNKDNTDIYEIINQVIKCFSLYFKKSNYEKEFGPDSFPNEEAEEIYDLFMSNTSSLNAIYNKNHLLNR